MGVQPNAIRFDMDVGTFLNDISDYTQRQNAMVALREAIKFLEGRINVVNPVQGDFVVDSHNDVCDGLLRDRTTKTNTDLLIVVQAKYTSSCGSSTLVHANPNCHGNLRDSFGRPLVGELNFCPNGLNLPATNHDHAVSRIVRELVHILGFGKEHFTHYKKSGTNEPVTNVFKTVTNEKGESVWKIITPNVIAKVRDHFDCNTLDGAELEDDSISQWKKRIFANEVMTGEMTLASLKDSGWWPTVDYSKAQPLSEMTLALLEDSGWYAVDYSKAQRLDGRHRGCKFAKGE